MMESDGAEGELEALRQQLKQSSLSMVGESSSSRVYLEVEIVDFVPRNE